MSLDSQLASVWALGAGKGDSAVPKTLEWQGKTWTLPGATAAERLWSLTAIEVHRQLVGQQPARPALRYPQTFSSTKPELPLAVAQAWEEVFLSHTPVIPELLGWLKNSGYRFPLSRWPTVLEGAAHQRASQDVWPVLDDDGLRWLLATNPSLNPAWHSAIATSFNPSTDWETATPRTRPAMLRQWRATDPASARQAMEKDWSLLPADERKVLIQCLEVGLGPEDEAWLETALDDRSRHVARQASYLLAKIPGSALRQRALDRGKGWVERTARKLLSAGDWKVVVPAPPTAVDKRDGLEGKQESVFTTRKLGDRASEMVQGLMLAPPSAWLALWGMTLDEIIERQKKDDFDIIRLGLLESSIIHRDGVTLLALLFSGSKQARDFDYRVNTLLGENLGWLSPVLTTWLVEKMPNHLNMLPYLRFVGPWPAALSAALCQYLSTVRLGTTPNHDAAYIISQAGVHASLDDAWEPLLESVATSPNAEWASTSLELWRRRRAVFQKISTLPKPTL